MVLKCWMDGMTTTMATQAIWNYPCIGSYGQVQAQRTVQEIEVDPMVYRSPKVGTQQVPKISGWGRTHVSTGKKDKNKKTKTIMIKKKKQQQQQQWGTTQENSSHEKRKGTRNTGLLDWQEGYFATKGNNTEDATSRRTAKNFIPRD